MSASNNLLANILTICNADRCDVYIGGRSEPLYSCYRQVVEERRKCDDTRDNVSVVCYDKSRRPHQRQGDCYNTLLSVARTESEKDIR